MRTRSASLDVTLDGFTSPNASSEPVTRRQRTPGIGCPSISTSCADCWPTNESAFETGRHVPRCFGPEARNGHRRARRCRCGALSHEKRLLKEFLDAGTGQVTPSRNAHSSCDIFLERGYGQLSGSNAVGRRFPSRKGREAAAGTRDVGLLRDAHKHFVGTTGVKAEKQLTPEETTEIKNEEEALPPLDWLTGNSVLSSGAFARGMPSRGAHSGYIAQTYLPAELLDTRQPILSSGMPLPAGVPPVDQAKTRRFYETDMDKGSTAP